VIRFLLNPAAGAGRGGRALPRIERAAAELGAAVERSSGSEDLAERARRAAAEGVERLVAVGGDGTFHHAIRGLAGSACALGMVPLGTGNDLASSLGIPRDVDAALATATGEDVGAIDVGAAGGRPFAVYCGVGFDSEVAEWVSRQKKGKLIYVRGVVRKLREFVPIPMVVEHDAGRFEGEAMMVIVANCPRFGGGMRIAPDADPADGLLELVLIERISKLALLTVFPRVFWGGHVGHPAVRIVRTRRARIRILDRRMTMFGDGEPLVEVGEEGVDVEVRPRALRVAALR